jgi:hypothetical protein
MYLPRTSNIQWRHYALTNLVNDHPHLIPIALHTGSFEEVHVWRTDGTRHKEVGQVIVKLLRWAALSTAMRVPKR